LGEVYVLSLFIVIGWLTLGYTIVIETNVFVESGK
jgi:hypothetical protein